MEIKENESIARYTTFQLGGAARYFIVVKTKEDLKRAFKFARDKNLSYFILSGGSNILVSDQGYNGVVIKMENSYWEVIREMENEIFIRAGAGTSNAGLAYQTCEKGISGFEYGVAVPGTIGGSIRGNAGCHGRETKDVLKRVLVLIPQNGTLKEQWLESKDCEYRYRESIFKKNKEWIIWEGEFKFQKDESKTCKTKIMEHLSRKKQAQPLGTLAAGSVFKNYEIQKNSPEYKKLKEKFGDELDQIIKNGKINAWWLIDQVDLRGFRIGGAQVSEKHTNFVINTGNAKASDIAMLVSLIKQKVRDNIGLELEEEIVYVGF